jgi:hypothetical protein
VDACALSDSRCLLLLSHAADPAVEERHSALILVDRTTASGSVLVEFPGASELVLWNREDGSRELDIHALVVSPGGHLWRLRPGGVVEPIRDAFGEDGPQKYGFLNCCTRHGEFVYVGGMSCQLYRCPLARVEFERVDQHLLDRDMSDPDSAIYGVADLGGRHLVGVGGSGLVFLLGHGGTRFLDSGTNVMLNAVCAVDSETFLACGAGGLVLRGSTHGWCQTDTSGRRGLYLSDVRTQGGQHLWIGGRRLYASIAGDRWCDLALIDDAPVVSRFARGGTSTWAIGSKHLGWTEDGNRWSWLQTDSIAITVRAD